MPKSAKLLLVSGLLVLMAVVGFLMTRSDDEQPPDMALPGAVSTVQVQESMTSEATPAAAPTGERAAVAATATEDAAPGDDELDPEIRAALAGFTGRVLNHDGTAAAATGVVLYRFDPDVVMTEVADLMTDSAVEPQVDAGQATTNEEGRFTIRGVWPRSLYLLNAGLGSDNPTPLVVERTPGNGELVDLGDIVLRNGAVVTGTLLDDGGKPLAGAEVRVVDIPLQILQMAGLERFDPAGAVIIAEGSERRVVQMPSWVKRRFDELPLPMARTAANGTFRVTGVPAGSNALVAIAAEHVPHLQPGLQLEAGEEKDIGEVRMREGEEAWGKVTDTRGQPIAGAEVLIGQGGALGEVYFAKQSITSGSDGSFSMLGFKSGKGIGAARREPGDPWIVGESQPLSRDLIIVLPATHSLTVRVTSGAGRPVSSPDFRLLPFDDGSVMMARFGMSNAVALDARMGRLEDGRYRFEGLNAGEYTLLVRSPGHAVTAKKIVMQGNVEETVQLKAGEPLAIRVMERSGKPVRSATIYAEPRGRNREDRVGEMPIQLGRTNSGGRLVADGIMQGEVRLSARHPKYGYVHETVQVPGQEVVLTFDDPGELEGTLTEKGNVPTPGKWTVIAMLRGKGRSAMPDMPRLTVPDLDGKFAFHGLQPGEYQLQTIETLSSFSSPGSFMQSMMMARFMGNRDEIETMVHSGRTTHVTLDTEKQPEVLDGPAAHVAGTVTINGLPAQGKMITGWGNQRVSGQVDASGRFDLGDVREGDLHLQVIDPDSMAMMGRGTMWSKSYQIVANQNLNIDIRLSTGSLQGMVVGADGAFAPGTQVRLNGVIGEVTEGSSPASASASTVTDASGRFEFSNVPLGRYTLRAENKNDKGLGIMALEITAGTREIELRLESTVTASGRIAMQALGQPDRIWMTFRREGKDSVSQWSQVDKEGNFTVDELMPGTYRASFWVNYDDDRGGKQFKHPDLIEVGPQGVEGLVLQPQAPPPPPQRPKAERGGQE